MEVRVYTMSTLPFQGQRWEALTLVTVLFAKTDEAAAKDSKSKKKDLLFTLYTSV